MNSSDPPDQKKISISNQSIYFNDLIDQAFSHLPKALLANFLLSSILITVLWNEVPQQKLIAWTSMLWAITIARSFQYHRYRSRTDNSAKNWAFHFSVGVTLTGVLWGASGIVLFAETSLPHQVFLVFVLGGLISGATTSLAARQWVLRVFVGLLFIPITVRFFLIGGEIYIAMGVMLLIYGGICIGMSSDIYAMLITSIHLRHENKDEIEERKKVENKLRHYKESLEEIVENRTASLQEEITIRKQVEDALRISNERYHQITSNLPGLVYQFMVHPDGSYSMPYISEGVHSVFGVTSEEVVEDVSSILQFLHPDDTQEFYHSIKKSAESLSPYNNEFRALIDGKLLWINAKSHPKKISTGEIIYDGILFDITHLKKMEAEKSTLESQLRQTHKMEAIGTLAGGIAHDFNNILAAILGYADMAKDDIPDRNPAQELIDEVIKAGNRAKDLVKQILAFSRKADQSRVPLQIHHLINEVTNFLRATIPSTIEIRLNIDPNCGTVLADPTQIHQILLNLCTNASHAMEEKGGVLTITLKAVERPSETMENDSNMQPSPYILLAVKDTGIGIESDHLERIFDPYYTTKEVGKGSGMGLAVVHGIVHSHEGLIEVESTPGQGTIFKLFFQRIDADVDQIKPDTSPFLTGTERILLVDDDPTIVNLTQARLEKLGYQVTSMTSSTETLALFASDPNAYDLVITDQTMPEITGVQLTKKLLKTRPDIPIIMCTGYSSTIDSEKANLIGTKAFIMKPIDTRELAKTVRHALTPSPNNN